MKAKIAALALLTGSAFFSTDILAAPGWGWVAGPERHMKCYSGKFSGEVKFRIYKNRYLNYQMVGITDYRIKRHNGQRGGNKANINLTAQSTGYRDEIKNSPDRMKQEGNWLPYEAFVDIADARSRTRRVAVKFIFDKSGWDPSCTVDYYLGPTE